MHAYLNLNIHIQTYKVWIHKYVHLNLYIHIQSVKCAGERQYCLKWHLILMQEWIHCIANTNHKTHYLQELYSYLFPLVCCNFSALTNIPFIGYQYQFYGIMYV